MTGSFVSMYSGAGGLDLGFISAGFSPVFSNDISPDAMATYKAMVEALSEQGVLPSGGHRIEVGDIRGVSNLPERHCADIVVGGPPCQGFSVAGKMDPNDPRSRHVFDFLAMVKHVDPKAFIMENVKALAMNSRWKGTREKLLEEATSMGYETHLIVLNAADFGVPQTRERMFLIGLKPEYAQGFREPSPAVKKPMTLRDALSDLPPIGTPGNDQTCKAKITTAKTPILRKSPWAGMLFNGQGRPMDLDRPAPTLPASMGGNRTPIVDQESLESGTRPWAAEYHERLMNDGAIEAEVPDRLRRISVNEAARIQTFPRDMPWFGSQSSRYRQIGNAVPPQLARQVALIVREALRAEGNDYPELIASLHLDS